MPSSPGYLLGSLAVSHFTTPDRLRPGEGTLVAGRVVGVAPGATSDVLVSVYRTVDLAPAPRPYMRSPTLPLQELTGLFHQQPTPRHFVQPSHRVHS